MAIKRWKLPDDDNIGRAQSARLSAETGKPELICAVLAARGARDSCDIEAFFEEAVHMDSPFLLKDMDKAVERIRSAIENGERIAVYGDYDCDGITSTAMLTSYLRDAGADVIYYVPDREREGYGMNKGAVDVLSGQGVGLIVTVDNGVSSHSEIEYAASLGIDTVVTDHHTPRDTLPDACAVVNPHRTDCQSRFKGLAGVGVAFKLVCALEDADASEMLEYYSDMVTLGTIADVVPLLDENRIIVRHGLKSLVDSEKPGISALMEVAGIVGKTLTGESVAFGLIPRINAAGRMGVADDAIELFLTDDAGYALECAAMIDQQNVQRKKTEDTILAQAERAIAADSLLSAKRVLIISGSGWHHGVVGIVAAKLMEKYAKPVILFSIDNGVARGSGRSIPGFSLIKAISACGERLLRFGGHTLAAGLSVAEEELDTWISELHSYVNEQYPVMPLAEYAIDCVLTPADMDCGKIGALSALEPFGARNEPPVFLLPDMRIDGIFPTSDGKHLRIRFVFGNARLHAVYFRMTEAEFPFAIGETVDVVASVSTGEWNNLPQLSVKIKDIRPSGTDEDELIESYIEYGNHLRSDYVNGKEPVIPSRDDIAAVYRHIRKNRACPAGMECIYYQMDRKDISLCRVGVSLDILLELGLVCRDDACMRIIDSVQKVELGSSAILTALAH